MSKEERSVILEVILSKKLCMYMCPIPHGFLDIHFTAHCTLYTLATRHVHTRVAMWIDVDGGIFENVLYKVNCTNFVTWKINAGISNNT
jgi:hypothetical protein